MDEKIQFATASFAALSSGLLFVLILRLAARRPQTLLWKAYEELTGFIRGRQRESPWYLRKQRWLIQNGAPFHFGKRIEPARYLAGSILLGALGMGCFFPVSPGWGVLAMGALGFLPRLLLEHLNRKDNERMLPEIKLVYHALEIQIQAGVYVTDALAECYGSVRERRLRQALLDLAGDIVMKADIYDALARFQSKFDNRYIDALCITVLQALESGQAVELLSDIGEQIKDMETSLLEHKKGSLDRSITFYQLGILLAVLGVTLYACVSHMFSTALPF